MSRVDDEKRLQVLKVQLALLKEEQRQSNIREMARRKAAEEADKQDPSGLCLNTLSLNMSIFPQTDNSFLIRQYEDEIRELEMRLSNSDAKNFIYDALDTAGSVKHVNGSWYSYSDKNGGCFKAILIVFGIAAVIAFIELLASGVI